MSGWDSGFGWKNNWDETRRHFIDWWNRKGLVVSTWGAWVKAPVAHAHALPPPNLSGDNALIRAHEDVAWRAQKEYARLASVDYGLDILPLADTNIGPGSLALAMGCEPGFSPLTVWFEPTWKDVADVRDLPPPRFNSNAHWWQVHEAQMRAHQQLARGAYLPGLPDLVENIDILAALRDPQTLMVDMIENPQWVSDAVAAINRAYFEAYDRLYALAKGPDNGVGYCAFNIWGPGKTAKVQCDAAAMFSPAMFEQFVVPALSEQCEWLDNSLFHLDGTHCIGHLDALLKINALDAIEWTPQAGIERGFHERWHPMYKRILDAGKSVQVVDVPPDQIESVLKVTGTNGVFIMTGFGSMEDVEQTARIVDRWR